MNNNLSKESSYLKKETSLSARMSKFVEASVEVDGVARVVNTGNTGRLKARVGSRSALTGSSPGVLDQNQPVPVFLQSYD